MRPRISWIIIILALLLLVGSGFILDLYFDYLWFQEIGKSTVFVTSLYAKSTMGAVTLLTVFLFLYLNLWYANSGPGTIQIGIPTPTGQITAYTFAPEMVRRILGLLSLVLAALFAMRAAEQWEIVWRWIHQVEFQVSDPVFGRDIAFFFFSLPVIQMVVRAGLLLCFLSATGVLALYHFKGVLTFGSLKGFWKRGRAGTHISLLGALFFVLLALDAYLDRFEILYANHGPMYGATYADLHARLPLLGLLAVASLAGAALWVYSAVSGKNRGAVVAVVLYIVVLILGNLYPALYQRFIVAPNELERESPQIRNNVAATLRAYGLDTVQERDLSGDKALTPEDIQSNLATIHSIRLWDHEPLLDAFSQIQEIRTYYDFVSVDNDRYFVDNEPQQMMLSSRELNSASLPERNWINEHLSYTHGYGITLGPVNRVTTEGLPVLLVKDIPPTSLSDVFKISRPEIYYGEVTRGYVIVKCTDPEFDYPQGDANSYAFYQGKGGVPVKNFMRKLLFALYFKDPNILLSPMLKPESRFMYFRDIGTRLSKVAPFLTLDRDPYMVISRGKLYWIQDAYTVGTRYPYSIQTLGAGNYIRNSVKMVLDAYDGTVDMYVSDPTDPLIRVYEKIFPGVFLPLSDMNEDLRKHLRYPEDIFRVQTYIYSIYHMENPQVFYNKEDLWQVPVLASGSGEGPMDPYYTVMRLPHEKSEEFILMLPFTPGRKDNLSAWMVARSDGEHYGQLVVYRFPKQKLVYGPKQIVARINQDAEISRQISLWDQRGSQVIQGTLLVIPIEEALLYVRPLYLRAESGKIPELKRVIVAYENKIAMEETLEASIARIFQSDFPSQTRPETIEPAARALPASSTLPAAGGSQDLVGLANETYARALQAQRQGDWAKYGEEIRRLGGMLEEMKRQASSKSPAER